MLIHLTKIVLILKFEDLEDLRFSARTNRLSGSRVDKACLTTERSLYMRCIKFAAAR